jgi:hypothetical protein
MVVYALYVFSIDSISISLGFHSEMFMNQSVHS